MYEELVKSLRETRERVRQNTKAAMFVPPYQISAAIDAIEELEEKSMALAETLYAYEHPWFPVTEEPPLKVGEDGYNGYLVYANGYYAVADYTTDKFDNIPYFHVDGEYEPDVTHYMLLPKLPKEGE